VNYSDLNIIADELASYGPEVVVLSPPHLRERVRSRLAATFAAHDDSHDGERSDG
jgi:proteasome accessory factor B